MVERKADGWMGFACTKCGTPLAVQRSDDVSKAGQHSARGWRVTCTGCGWITPKVQVYASESEQASVGVMHFLNVGDGNFGIAYVVGTRGTADSAVMRAEL